MKTWINDYGDVPKWWWKIGQAAASRAKSSRHRDDRRRPNSTAMLLRALCIGIEYAGLRAR